MTVTNPASSETWPELFLDVFLTGIRNLTAHTVTLQYKDASGTWCSLVTFEGRGEMSGTFLGLRSTCTTPSFPASFAMTKGSSSVIPFRIAFPTSGYYGIQNLKATLNTGTCTTLTTTTLILVRCTATAPLTGNVSPSGTASITLRRPHRFQTSDFADKAASSPSGARSTSGSSRVLVRRYAEPRSADPDGDRQLQDRRRDGGHRGFPISSNRSQSDGAKPLLDHRPGPGRHTLVSTYSGGRA